MICQLSLNIDEVTVNFKGLIHLFKKLFRVPTMYQALLTLLLIQQQTKSAYTASHFMEDYKRVGVSGGYVDCEEQLNIKEK